MNPDLKQALLPLSIKSTLLSFILATPGMASAVTPEEIQAEFAVTPGKSGGIYYTYPYTTDSVPSFPSGYEPVYISHYGRHGSRWALNESQYPHVIRTLEREQKRGNLTPVGEEVLKKVRILSDHAQGHAGELSPLGQRQHKGIARRMLERTPQLFTDSAKVSALSSIVPRCIISMAAFCESLKEVNPGLRIERASSPGDMDFIAYTTPEAKAFTADTLGFRKDLFEYREHTVMKDRLVNLLFKENPFPEPAPRSPQSAPRLSDAVQFMKCLHDIAVTTQNLEVDVDLLSIFTPEELYSFWLPINYNMYVRHGNSPQGERLGMLAARSLLDDIITRADKALAASGSTASGPAAGLEISQLDTLVDDEPKVQLRFGHDTNLIRLLALMQLDGLSESEADPDRYYAAWQDYRVSPMGANLQLIFIRPVDQPRTTIKPVSDHTDTMDTSGEPLVLILHNERPVTVPIISETAPFYPWSALKALWR